MINQIQQQILVLPFSAATFSDIQAKALFRCYKNFGSKLSRETIRQCDEFCANALLTYQNSQIALLTYQNSQVAPLQKNDIQQPTTTTYTAYKQTTTSPNTITQTTIPHTTTTTRTKFTKKHYSPHHHRHGRQSPTNGNKQLKRQQTPTSTLFR